MSVKLDVATISDKTEVKSQDTFVRTVCAGKPLVVTNALSGGNNNENVRRPKERHAHGCLFNTIQLLSDSLRTQYHDYSSYCLINAVYTRITVCVVHLMTH